MYALSVCIRLARNSLKYCSCVVLRARDNRYYCKLRTDANQTKEKGANDSHVQFVGC